MSEKNRRLGRGLASLMANTRNIEQADEAAANTDIQPQTQPAAQNTSQKAAIDSAEGKKAGVYLAVDTPVGAIAPISPVEVETQSTGTPREIELADIRPNPYQPRRSFDESELSELASSIRAQGILQPLLVVEIDGGYTLVAGERRLRAASLAGLKTAPCVIRTATREEMFQWALVENIQRSDLSSIEKAQAYREYLDTFDATQQILAEKLGESRSSIANHLRLLDLCDDVQDLIAGGSLSFGHGKVLAALAGYPDKQVAVARRVVENSLSVRQLEQIVAKIVNSGHLDEVEQILEQHDKPESAANGYIQDVERQLTRAVGTKVAIKQSKKPGRGKIVLSYSSLDEFDRITEVLGIRLDS